MKAALPWLAMAVSVLGIAANVVTWRMLRTIHAIEQRRDAMTRSFADLLHEHEMANAAVVAAKASSEAAS